MSVFSKTKITQVKGFLLLENDSFFVLFVKMFIHKKVKNSSTNFALNMG